MIQEIKATFQRFLQIANLPADTQEQRQRKENLMLMVTHFSFVGFVWGSVYFFNGLRLPGLIPLSYPVVTIISIGILLATKRFALFRNIQLFLVLMMPFMIHLSVGGFIPSSGAILWAIVSPMAALFFINIRQAVYWFGVFVISIIVAFLIDEQLARYYHWEITDQFIDALFLLNIVGVSGLVFLVQVYFARNERSLKAEVEKQNDLLGVQSDQLKELDRIKSNFFANISHEFRTPLTLIQGILNKKDTPSQAEFAIMQRNSDRLLQLINQLLDLAKLESGKMVLQKKTIDVHQMAKKTAQLFGSAAEVKSIQFHINEASILEPETEAILMEADPEQIQKVLANLMSNAIKFCPEDGNIDMRIHNTDDIVHLTISNTGDDIPETQLAQLFNRFHQVESDSTRGYEGTGIGLSLVHEIIDLHGGEITVTSQNRVVCFEITLPKGQVGEVAEVLMPAKAQDSPAPVSEEAADAGGKDLLKVLVVEDYPDLRQFIKGILSPSYTVLEAPNGEVGVEMALAEIPDLIISDVMMPKKDGNQLCAELKSHPATDHIPIILLTARAGQADKVEGLEQGADDYLTKPFHETELLLRVNNILKTRQKLQEKYQQGMWLKPSAVKVSSTQERFLQQLKEALEENLSNETLTVEELASMMALSRSQFHRKLKALTNQSATEFVRTYRLERGADLLKQGFGTVSEVAYEVGFNSQTYFSSCFQKHFGCSPSVYGKG